MKLLGGSASFLLLIGIAVSLAIVGEFSGEFAKIRQLASKRQNAVNITRGRFNSLNNGVFFGFDVDSKGNDILEVRLPSNQTFSWYEKIENGKRVFRSENFTLDGVNWSFEIDVIVRLYDKQTLTIVDQTKPLS